MSLNAPAAPTAAPVNHVARARSPQDAAAGHGSSHGASASFAQLLQGAVNDEPEAVDAATSPKPTADDDEHSDVGAERPAEHEHRADVHKRLRDPVDDATPPTTTPTDAPATPTELAASLRGASLLAAVRAKLGAEASGHGRHGLAAADKSLPTLDDKAGADARHITAFGAPSAPEAGQGLDISGLKPTLDNTPVNLATAAVTDAVVAEAGAEFSLPSLGVAGDAPAAPAPTPEAPPAQATLVPAPGSAAFPAALGAQLSTWLKDGVQYATLELNPQDMGPIDVRIALRDGRTEVQLGADVAATRAALTEALPELAEALGDVGLSLSGGSVSDQTGQHARQGDPQAQRTFALPGWLAPARAGSDTAAVATAAQPAQRGLIDLVA
ncbi:MAG TPA: flagellar hook-length control protein FliK [Ideonella sp.]|uniref:flagellar hook-length control protein FliK n=1 Tax=Ideonella sp. TaxID=1929293 RepID=UPI002E35EA52|nr:flagellar hook-length control protein FliK [Ideonella sp.]HEX5685317.1 flagellar hook-length control protein FliK [Ideonella sp.]